MSRREDGRAIIEFVLLGFLLLDDQMLSAAAGKLRLARLRGFVATRAVSTNAASPATSASTDSA